jgi:uncharacterized protein
VAIYRSGKSEDGMLNASLLVYTPSPSDLIQAVVDRSPNSISLLHGEEHWRSVAHVGLEIGAATPGADLELVFLFSLLHDAMRRTDFGDPNHGRRAGGLIRDLKRERLLDLPQERERVLLSACCLHSDGSTSPDPTIGACWDADRLNLWRVGLTPVDRFLSTPEGRRPERAAWALDALGDVPSWMDLLMSCR